MIWCVAIIYGAILGNAMTSAFYRIPRNIKLRGIGADGIKPHCASCGTFLRFWEYLPVLSWIFSRKGCNYCGVKIDPIYTALEISMMLISVILCSLYGFDIEYAIALPLYAVVILNIALYTKYRQLFLKSVTMMLVSTICYILLYV